MLRSFFQPLTHSLTGSLLFLLSVSVTGAAVKLLINRHDILTVGELLVGAVVVLGLAFVSLYTYLVLSVTETPRR